MDDCCMHNIIALHNDQPKLGMSPGLRQHSHRKAEMEEAQGLWTVLVTDQWVEPSLRQVTNFLVKILSKVTLPFPSSN